MITPNILARLIVAGSIAALLVAFTSQFAGGLVPCPLCLWQRVPYEANILLGLLAVYMVSRGRTPLALMALCGMVFAVDAGIAFYHVGVEGGWFEGLAACAGGGETPDTVDQLRAMLLDKPPAPPCNEVQWSMFNISMAGYNLLYATMLTGISLYSVVVLKRKAETA